MYRRHRLLFFILEIVGLIILLSFCIPVFSGAYSSFVAGMADLATPGKIMISADNSTFLISHKEWPIPMSMHSLPFLGGFILILALLIATPGISWKKRPLYIILGSASSLALQAFSLIVIGLLAYFNAGLWLGRSISTLFISVGIDLFPILIWSALSYKHWWPIFSRQETADNTLFAGKG